MNENSTIFTSQGGEGVRGKKVYEKKADEM